MQTNNRTAKIPLTLLPTAEEAVHAYQQTGGVLTLLPRFGHDPLDGHENLISARRQGFSDQYPDFEQIFSNVVNGNMQPFKCALLLFISLTSRLSHSV